MGLLAKCLKDHLPPEVPEFIFTSVNKDYGAKLHRDRSKVGPSFIQAFGSFSGGSLRGSNASPSRSSWTTSTLGVELQGHNVLA